MIQQSTPFMPPIGGNMTSCQVFLFGDLAAHFEDELRQLLYVEGNESLRSFFERVSFALREECGKLSSSHQELFPRFTTLVDLISKLGETEGTPVLRFCLLVVCEIGQFLRHYGEGSHPYPTAVNSYCLGLCTGSFAAAAISTSQTLSELIPAGVEAALTAFRTALRSLVMRNDLGKPSPGTRPSWSAVINVQEDEALKLIDRFCLTKRLPHSAKPYLSAASPTNVTVSCSPSVLEEFLTINALKAYYLPIESPYHAPHLFGAQDADEIISQFHDPLGSYKPRIPVWSAASGNPIIAADFKSLLYEVITDTLCRPVQWKRVLESTVESLRQTGFKECEINVASSSAATLLSSAIAKGTQIHTTVNTLSNGNHSMPKLLRPTGRFEQSKIAIVGYSGRFPDAASNEEFWELLHAGKDVHRHIPEDRFDWKAHFDPTGKAKNTSKIQYGCFIKEPGLFDSRFFNISPKEAENTDPAQRLAITTTYEALEMSGLVPNRTPSTQQDRIGVYFGVTSDDWREVNSGQNVGTYFIPGGNRAFVPGRISYFFRFSGPSLSVDTACSSSFAAIQTACGNLWRGECDTAIAGGTNVLTNPDNFAGLDRGHFLSTTGNCNAFDDEASGYCRADAVGSVILKRLEDAEADNDPIFGVIAGAYTNHCGQTESITRPHEGDQASVFKKIIRRANVDPKDIGYVEMHGTGTQAGDATEMNSVLSVMVPERERMPHHPLYLGSAKANIGHGESASGVSSLIKVLMMMKNNEIPPHCGIKTKINHNYPLDLKERNVNIAFKPVPWHRTDSVRGKRSVFLNNFSAAGGNTALLLEDAPLANDDVNGEDDFRSVHLVSITGKSAKSLAGNVSALINFLEENNGTSLPALSYTTTARRMHYNYRTLVSGSSIKSVLEGLKKRLANTEFKSIPSAIKTPKVAFVFTGQGTLYTSIGKQLFESLSCFRADILRFNSIARQQGFPSFLPLVDGSALAVEDVELPAAHLALTCVQMAISRLWTSWGVHPTLTTGHSLGEYAALYAAGVLTVSDTIYLVGTRAQLLLNHCRKGTHTMLAVKATFNDMKIHLEGSLCQIACMNQPTSNVISGPNEEIERLTNVFQRKGFECIRLDIPFAFHSAQVEPILEEFESAAGSVHYHRPSVPYASPLLGAVVSDGDKLDASYLARACRNPVNFQGALDSSKTSSLTDDQTIWLEIGLHPACSGMIKGTIGSQVTTVPSLRKGTDTWKVLASGLETLYLNGISIEWNEWHRDFKSSHKVLQLPRYSWDLKNYWIQYKNNFCLTKGDDIVPKQITAQQVEQKPRFVYVSPSVQRVLEEHNKADFSTLLVESDIQDPRLAPVVQGHKVNGATLCPSSLYADIALTMTDYMLRKVQMQTDNIGLDVGNMQIDQPLIAIPTENTQLIRISASADWKSNVITFSLYSVNYQGKKTTSHATCQVRISPNQTWQQDWKRNAYLIKSRISMLRKGVDEGDSHKLKRGIVYKLFAALVDYEPQYQGMQEVVLDSNELEATSLVSFQVNEDGHYFNPCWVDSLGHIAGFIMNGNDNTESKSQVFVNHGWDAMRCAAKLVKGKTYQTYNKMQLVNGTLYAGDTYILDEGNIVAIFEGVRFQGVPRRVLDVLLPSNQGGRKGPEISSRPTATGGTEAMDKPSAKPPTKSDVVPAKSTLNSNISRVLAIISEEVGIDTAELKPESEFAEFGIDSLLSLTISGRLREELGLDLSGGLFLEYPTVKEFQSYIDGANDPSLASGSSSKDETDVLTPDTTSEQGAERHIGVIRATICEETGIPIEDLTDSAKLSELGVDSLLSLTTMGKLSEALEMELPRSLFAENDTLGELERALYTKIQQDNGINTPDSIQVEAIAPIDDVDSAPHATSILLQGNPKTAAKKLFMFPDGSGSATSYSSLASISADVAVYGLNCPWMKTPQNMKCNLEYLSSKFLAEIRRRQPQGPYYFGGWSAGGICAYEAAQQLSRIGAETARLILIDSPNPIGLENPPQRMYDFFESVGIFGSEGKAPPTWLRPHFDAFIRLLDDYEATTLEGGPIETHIIYARDGICKNPSDPRPEIRPDDPREMIWLLNNRTDFSGSGWAGLVGERNLKIHVLDDVNHFSMMDLGPKSGELGAFIRRAMK